MIFGRVKPLDAILATAEKKALHRTLGWFQLTLFGIGCVIGTGIFVLTSAGAQKAGPGLMLAFAIIGFVLRGNDEMMQSIENAITENLSGQMGETVSSIIDSAVSQAGGVFTIGFITALWSGLSWMGNLRMGVTALWKRPIIAENFVMGKLRDFLRLLGMMLMIALTFAVTAIGSSGLTSSLVEKVGLDGVPGIGILTTVVAVALGLVANWILFFWMLASLPRGKVPMKPAMQGACLR